MKHHDNLSLWFDGWSLALEASTVVAMRLSRLATMNPGAAATEIQLMVTEKVGVAMAIQNKAMTGGLGLSSGAQAKRTISHYRKAVARNRRRLSRPK